MKRLAAALDRTAQKWFPAAYYSLIQRPKIQKRFTTEAQLLRGASLSQSPHSSILFFTTQKCASRYVGRVLEALSDAEGLVRADYDAYVTTTKLPDELRPYSDAGALKHAFQPKGYLYGPIGSFRNIPNRPNYRVLLQLRDPRDVLTSLYYSSAYSHPIINRKLLKRRKEAVDMTVDEYVLANAEHYFQLYERYCNELLSQPEVLFVQYELMVSDFPNWLEQVCEHLNLTRHQAVIDRLLQEANFQVDKEDKYSHRRQVTPGDHLRKLQSETVAQLNQRFAPVLPQLGYKP
ncbi:MAG: hypothetical protein DWG76_05835 [Chloroflexi bacterium]|nr:hypothetical protein [Chloroflexota bacterium]